MKKVLFAIAVLVVVIGAGFASNRFRHKPTPFSMTGHTVVFRTEFFDDFGKSLGKGSVVRIVSADGIWRNITILPDGVVKDSHGKVSGPLNADPSAPTTNHLGYSCKIVSPTKGVELWVNNDLQEFLRTVHKNPDGSPSFTMEAVEVKTDAEWSTKTAEAQRP